ncbi:CapA family protein [Vibrio campbellii]|nr:CapA family protein [Vibrio campbellii]
MKFFLAGDVLNINKKEGSLCSDTIEALIKSADFSFCNLEAPLKARVNIEKEIGIAHGQSKNTIKILKQHGFQYFLLANNHMMDFGDTGLIKTIKEISNNNAFYLGAGVDFNKAYEPLILDCNGYKVGVINASERQYGTLEYGKEGVGYAWINDTHIDKLIPELKKKCDKVFLFSHAGLENITVPQDEWRDRYKYLCELGVDVVCGSHPHVPQGIEEHRGSIIFYSLGNFYFDSPNYENKPNHTFSVLLDIDKDLNISYELVYHSVVNGEVVISNKCDENDVEILNSRLSDDNFYTKIISDRYDKLKADLIYSLLDFDYDGGLKTSLRRLYYHHVKGVKKVNKSKYTEHIFNNESYMYLLQSGSVINSNKDIFND